MRSFLLGSILWLPTLCAALEKHAPWPQINGPAGNFTPPVAGVPLIDDIAQARRVWQSACDDLGYAKGSVSGYLSNLARWDGHPGSAAGPIIAEGKIFVTTFRPSGKPVATEQPQLAKIRGSKKPLTEAEHARMMRNLRILADDLLVAIDQTSGKTLWKVAEAEAGLNRYMGKRGGYNVAPAYHDGMVFSVGTTGLLRAYDAESGNRLWEKPLEKARAIAMEARDKALDKKVLSGGLGWNSSLTIADGVLVVPLFDGGRDHSLRGVDPRRGETLWEVRAACSRWTTPAIWSHGDRQYVVCGTEAGELRLIDPKRGSVLWTIAGLGPNLYSLTPTKSGIVIVNGGSNTLRREGKDQKYGLLAAYQLGPEKTERLWKHPEDPKLFLPTWMDSCARRFLAVDGDRVYYYARNRDKDQAHLMMLDEKTGKVTAAFPLSTPAPHFYPAEDRLLMIRDASHSDTDLALVSTDPSDFRMLNAEFWRPPHQATTAYEVLMEHPLVDGRLYLRTKDGRIACYDLRAPKP